MKTEYNTMAFPLTDEGLDKALEVIKALKCDKQRQEHSQIDLHLWDDGTTLILDFIQAPYSQEWGGHFGFVPCDGLVMYETFFPDHSSQFVASEDEEREAQEEWRKNNPDYNRNN